MATDLPTPLEQAGLPLGHLLSKRDALPVPLQVLHRRVLLTLARTGQPPTRLSWAPGSVGCTWTSTPR